MDACQVLLLRLWQSNRDSKHRGLSNIYHIKHEGKKFNLYHCLNMIGSHLLEVNSVEPRELDSRHKLGKGFRFTRLTNEKGLNLELRNP